MVCVGELHSRGAFGAAIERAIEPGAGGVGSFSWRSRAPRLVGSVTRRRRLTGPVQTHGFCCVVMSPYRTAKPRCANKPRVMGGWHVGYTRRRLARRCRLLAVASASASALTVVATGEEEAHDGGRGVTAARSNASAPAITRAVCAGRSIGTKWPAPGIMCAEPFGKRLASPSSGDRHFSHFFAVERGGPDATHRDAS